MRYAHRLWFIRALILANLGIIRLKVPVPGISSVPVPLQERTKRPMAGHELLPDADDETRYSYSARAQNSHALMSTVPLREQARVILRGYRAA
jgi:hypothetical protein